MDSLSQFNQPTAVSLDDFQSQKGAVAPVSNRPSNTNLAAHAAALSPDPTQAVQAYQQSNAELSMQGKSQAADTLLQTAQQASMQSSKASLTNYLADPSVSDKDKYNAAVNTLDPKNPMYDTRNVLSQSALIQPSGRENNEQEFTRVNMADAINEVNQYKYEAQMVLNKNVAATDPSMLNALGNFLETLVPGAEEKYTGSIVSGLKGGDASAFAAGVTMMGSTRSEIQAKINSVPPAQRMQLTQQVVDMVNQHSSIVMPGSNDYAKVEALRTYLEDGYYDNTSKWADNITNVLDLTVLGGVAARGIKGAVRGAEAAFTGGKLTDAAINGLERDAVRSRVQPTTVSQNYKDTNPTLATAAHEAAASDPSGQAAEALYGTTKVDAVGNDLLPEVGKVDGSVRNKVGRPESLNDAAITPNPDVMDFVNNDGAIHYWDSEKRAMRASVVNDFEQAKGLNARKEMFNVESVGDGVNVKAVYGPAQGGFSNAEDAMAMAKFALRDYGVSDDAITLLRRQGPDYVPVEKAADVESTVLADKRIELQGQEPSLVTSSAGTQTDIGSRVVVKRKPDFLVQVNHNYKFSPGDVAQWAEADVKYNVFDRIDAFNGTGGSGSLQRHLVDAHSMLHPNITLGANVAVAKAAGLEKELLKTVGDFAEQFKGLPKERQGLLESAIKDANAQGTDFNYNKMIADGYSQEEMNALHSWRESWDTMYHLENKDMLRTMRARNYHELVDESTDTRLFVKPLSRTQVAGDVKVLDHREGTIKTMTADKVSELYDKGGTMVKLRQPMKIGDEAAELMVSEEAAGKSYVRALNDDSQVLNYRKGYYTVHYKDPHFIVKKVTNSRGETLYEKAVATAGNIKDAELMTRRMAATDGGEYYHRTDKKKMDMSSNDYWDIQQAGGRSAQKIRGQRLEDATSTFTDPSMTNILGPVDSAIASARSVSRRVAMRDFMESVKERAMKQYSEYMPTGKFGQKGWPNNIKEVKYYGGHTLDQKKLADARTTFEYAQYLENGYINQLDDGYKAVLKGISHLAGTAGLSRTEKVADWAGSSRGPSGMAKNLAFNMYLALNPARQLVVQAHQLVQLAANFPRYIASGRIVPELATLVSFQMGYRPSKSLLKGVGMSEAEAYQMFKMFEKTGLSAAVDKQNLIRGALSDLSDTVSGGKLSKTLGAPLNYMRKIGFDAGENINSMSSWLAHRDDALRNGMDMNKADVQDMVTGKSINYTYNMNAAGDMPYNQNAVASLFQFMQVPHKAMLGMLTNRSLTPAQKLRLVGFNTVMYSLPVAMFTNWFGDILPDNKEARDAVTQGLEGYTLNKLITLASGSEASIDFSGLSPIDLKGTGNFIASLFTSDAGKMVASTPSGQLLFGNNPRLTNLAKTASRYFNLVDDYSDPTTFGHVALDFAKLSSGFSNAYKAAYALEYQKKINTMGGITDSNVTTPTAIAQVFGFQSITESQRAAVNDKMYQASKAHDDDVRTWFKDYKRHITAEGQSPAEMEQVSKTYSEAWRVWKNDLRAQEVVNQELRKDSNAGDSSLVQSVMRMNGVMTQPEIKSMIKTLPMDEAKRKSLQGTMDFMDSYKEKDE